MWTCADGGQGDRASVMRGRCFLNNAAALAATDAARRANRVFDLYKAATSTFDTT